MRGKHNEDRREPESVAAVLKVFALLQALAERREASAAELALQLVMPQATALQLLCTAEMLGYVRDDGGRWGLTLKTFELGALALQSRELVEIAKPAMRRLADVTGESVQLGALDEGQVTCLHKIDSRHPLGLSSRIGLRAPLHSTAIGKAMLAWQLPPRLLDGGRGGVAPLDAAFARELEQARHQGFSEEAAPHVRGVGVPVFDHLGQPVAGLGVYVPVPRFDEATVLRLAAQMQSASREISLGLGWSPR